MNNPYDYLKDYIGKPMSYTKEFCPLLNLEKKRGKAKELQLKKIGEYLELGRENCKITIKHIYTDEEIKQTIKPKRPNITSCELKYYLKNSLVSDRTSFFNHGGIYKIQYENKVYIGQTYNFKERFSGHKRQESRAFQLIKQGGTFEILEVEDNKGIRVQKEKQYILQYCRNKDYECINDDYNFTRVHLSKKKKKKRDYLNLKVKVEDYEKIVELLEREGIFYE